MTGGRIKRIRASRREYIDSIYKDCETGLWWVDLKGDYGYDTGGDGSSVNAYTLEVAIAEANAYAIVDTTTGETIVEAGK